MAKKRRKHQGIFGFVLAGLSAGVSITLIVLMSLAACDKINIIREIVTVRFFGANNQLLEEQQVEEFSPVKYTGPRPYKESDGNGPYEFLCWDKDLRCVWHNIETHAKFIPLSALDDGFVGELPDMDLDKIPKTPMMNITSSVPGFVYLRTKSFGDYERSTWTNGPTYDENKLAESFTNPMNYAGYLGARTSLIPPVPIEIEYLQKLKNTPVPQYSSKSDMKCNNDTGYPAVPNVGYKYSTDTYPVDPVLLPETFQAIKKARLNKEQERNLNDYKRFVSKHYKKVNDEVAPILKDILREDGIVASDSNVLSSVAKSLDKRMKWKKIGSGAKDPYADPVISCLTETHIGNASQFAAAATLMFRCLNIPARFVNGYVGIVPYDMVNKPCTVYNFQDWFWCEIFVDKLGWVQVDPLSKTVTELFESGEYIGSLPSYGGNIDMDVNFGEGIDVLTKDYDGLPFDINKYVKIDDKTKKILKRDNVKIEFKANGLDEFINVGRKMFNFETHIYNKSNKDITKLYKFDPPLQKAVLEILPRKLDIIFDTEYEVPYDGNPHFCPYKTQGLLDDHEIEFDATPFTDVGDYEITGDISNVFIYDKLDPMRRNVASNYDIEIHNGFMTIYEVF